MGGSALKRLTSELLDAGIMLSLEGHKIHYKAYRKPDKEKAPRLLNELKARKREAVTYLARQEELYNSYRALFREMSRLYRQGKLPEGMTDELLALDRKVDAMAPDAMEAIRALSERLKQRKNSYEPARMFKV